MRTVRLIKIMVALDRIALMLSIDVVSAGTPIAPLNK